MTSLGYLVRALSAFLLVFGTWNPYGYSFWTWAMESDARLSAKIALGVAVAMTLALYMRICWCAFGFFGIFSGMAAALVFRLMLTRLHLVDDQLPFLTDYFYLLLASCLFAGSLCWSHFKRQYMGQSQVISNPP